MLYPFIIYFIIYFIILFYLHLLTFKKLKL